MAAATDHVKCEARCQKARNEKGTDTNFTNWIPDGIKPLRVGDAKQRGFLRKKPAKRLIGN